MDGKRIGIVTTFADGGEIENSTLFLMRGIAEIVDYLCIVINGEPKKSELQKVMKITDCVHVRGDTGYDCGAFKYGIEEVLGWEKIRKYQELVLANDSCFGPMYPLEDMFESMQEKNCDFWTVTDQPQIKRGKYIEEILPYHVQPYFLVIREKMLNGTEIVNFWEQVELSDEYEKTVNNFELAFAKYFMSYGYKPGTYIEGKEFCQSVEEVQAYVFFDSFHLISEYKCPLIKRKAFLFPEQEILASNAGETVRRTLEYIREKTNYDEDLVWEYIIKKSNLFNLKNVLHLNYICSKKVLISEKMQDTPMAILLLAYSNEMLEKFLIYIKNLEEKIPVYMVCMQAQYDITQTDYDIKIVQHEALAEVYRMLLENYEFICLINEKEMFADEKLREKYIKVLLENAIGSKIYVKNVLNLFYENKKLGMLALPKPYLKERVDESFENNVENGFWARTKSLLNAEEPICAVKKNRYYIGEVFTEECASSFLLEWGKALKELIQKELLPQGVEEFGYLFNINSNVLEFARKNRKIYVYGAGAYGDACIRFLEKNNIMPQGVIVSDGMKKKEEFLSYPVYEFGKINLGEDVGIIVALNEKNTHAIERMLECRLFKNYSCFSK